MDTIRAIYVDMNAYFASAEQQMQPHLRGRPVAVAPITAETGTCIAVSYEARPYGVRTGTAVWRARQLCPQIAIVDARPERYIEMHHKIVAAVESCLPVASVLSIDEMSCKLLRNERPRAVEIAKDIKAAIADQVGRYARCSIGIGTSVLIAKIAGEMRKPDGLTVIRRCDLPDALYDLELDDLPGIAKGMMRRLRSNGVTTVRELCALPEKRMAGIWSSIIGRRWYRWLRGEEVWEPPMHTRSMGHQNVLAPKLRTRDNARLILLRLTHKVGHRLRHTGYWARWMEIRIDHIDGYTWHRRVPLGLCQDTPTLVECLNEHYEDYWYDQKPVIVGVTLTHLVPACSASMPLYGDELRRLRLSRAMDRINQKYGRHAIYCGSVHDVRSTSPVRIAFKTVPDLDLQS